MTDANNSPPHGDEQRHATPATARQRPATASGAWGLLVQQMAAAHAAGVRPKPHRPNPRPPGVIQPGSATDAVLRLMRSAPDRRWRRAQLLRLTGRTESAVDWALLYLRSLGQIEAEAVGPDSAATRSFRYRLTKGEHHD